MFMGLVLLFTATSLACNPTTISKTHPKISQVIKQRPQETTCKFEKYVNFNPKRIPMKITEVFCHDTGSICGSSHLSSGKVG